MLAPISSALTNKNKTNITPSREKSYARSFLITNLPTPTKPDAPGAPTCERSLEEVM